MKRERKEAYYVILKKDNLKQKSLSELRIVLPLALSEPEPTLPFGLCLSEPTYPHLPKYLPYLTFEYQFYRKTTKNHIF